MAFPVGRVEEADSVLGGYHQVVLVRRDIADDVGRQGLRITCFHAVVCELPRAYVQSVQSAQMGSYPDDVFGGIIIESLDVVMGNTVGTDFRAEPFELTGTAVVIVQSAPSVPIHRLPSLSSMVRPTTGLLSPFFSMGEYI